MWPGNCSPRQTTKSVEFRDRSKRCVYRRHGGHSRRAVLTDTVEDFQTLDVPVETY
jgi:hypothetical protein